MSRPMALGLILLVLFLTSQSDWKPPREGQDESDTKGGKTDMHREEIKEKIIVDLTAHNKRLASENSKLRRMVSEVRDLLKDCRCAVPPNTTTALLEIDSSAETSRAETPSAYETEKEEVELLGGRTSSDREGVSEKSQLGVTKVRMGHALAGNAQGHVLREGVADRLEAEVEAEAATLPRGVGMEEGKLWPRAGRGYGEGDALLGEAQPRGPSVEG